MHRTGEPDSHIAKIFLNEHPSFEELSDKPFQYDAVLLEALVFHKSRTVSDECVKLLLKIELTSFLLQLLEPHWSEVSEQPSTLGFVSSSEHAHSQILDGEHDNSSKAQWATANTVLAHAFDHIYVHATKLRIQ